MRWKEINEAPLADFGTYGDLDTEGSFRSGDLKAMQNPKWIEKVDNYLKKCPRDINLYLVNKAGNRDFLLISERTGVQPIQVVEQIIGKKVPNSEQSITVVLMHNEGAERIALTPWIVAHRIAHALLTPSSRQDDINQVAGFVELGSEFLSQMASFLISTEFGGADPKAPMGIADRVKLVGKICKFKSAEAGSIGRPGELFVELFTQYLVQGRVSFKRPEMDGNGRYEAPVLTDVEQKLLNRAKKIPNRIRALENAAEYFADTILNYNEKGKKLNPALKEPKPWFVTQNENGDNMGSFSKKESAEQNAEQHGYTVKEMTPTKSQITLWKKTVARRQALIDLYIKFDNLGMLDFNYPRGHLTKTDEFNKLADDFEEKLNNAINRIMVRCIGKAIFL